VAALSLSHHTLVVEPLSQETVHTEKNLVVVFLASASSALLEVLR
jgi:hypothetical protein